jgi:hypothetical protein
MIRFKVPSFIRGRNLPIRMWMAWGILPITVLTVIYGVFIMPGPDAAAYFPDPGVYNLPVERSMVDAGVGNSLTITVPQEIRVTEFKLSNLHIGAGGITNVLQVASSTGDDIKIESLTIDGLSCPRLTISSADISNLIFTNNRSDGNSHAYTGGNPSQITIASERISQAYSVTNGASYDKIYISGGANGGKIKDLTITDVRVFGGYCLIEDIDVGTLTVMNSIFGVGDGPPPTGDADFVLGTNVTVGTFTGDANIEGFYSVD